MSVELAVRVGERKIYPQEVLDRIREVLGLEAIRWEGDEHELHDTRAVRVAVGSAEVEVRQFGPIDSEDTAWMLVTVATRIRESFLLASVVTAVLAELWETPVVDEACHFRGAVELPGGEVIAAIKRATGSDFAATARRFCEPYDMSFGGQ